MRKYLSLVVISVGLVCGSASAQANQSPQSTEAPNDSRFEVIQSELAARWTFRLDKQCGRVAQLVSTELGGVAWQEMMVLNLPDCDLLGRLRYQIFTSGLAARHTFLIDTQSGRSWILTENSDSEPIWDPFEI